MRIIQIFTLAIICLLCQVSAYAYVPTVQENKTWKIINYGLATINYLQTFQGDSTIGNVQYKKLYTTSLFGEPYTYFTALFREDVSSQKVFMWDGAQERLMFDYSLNAGDQITVSALGGETTLQVAMVSTVNLGGVDRKRIDFDSSGSIPYWIEGMGSIHGVQDPALGPILDYYPIVVCYFEGETLVFNSTDVPEDCMGVLAVGDQASASPLHLWPNPARDYILVDGLSTFDSGRKQYEIVDQNGRLVLSAGVNSRNVQSISVAELPAGVYVLRWKSEKGAAISQKFIVEK